MIRTQMIQIFNLADEEADTWWAHREHAYCGQSHVAHSELLVCPKCCEPWAILKFVQDPTYVWPMSQFCEQCNVKDEWHPVPGSILVEEGWGVIDDALLAALPDTLLEREFRLHIKAYQS